MSANTKIIPTVLDSNKTTTNVVLVSKVGADTLNGDTANITNINAEIINSNAINTNNIKTSTLGAEIINGEIINGTKGNFENAEIQKATISNEDVTYANINELHNKWIGTDEIQAKKAKIDSAEITNLFSNEITTDYLKVLKSAHFFELIIDQIKAVGGSIILSPADGFELYGYSDETQSQMTLWWIAKDDAHGKFNMWKVGDQIICQNFNNAHVGTSQGVSSKFCWTRVINILTTQWVAKLGSNDVVTVISNNDYDSTHQSLKKSDFLPATPNKEEDGQGHPLNGMFKLRNGTTVIDAVEYESLPDSEKQNYEIYQDAYFTNIADNQTLYITEGQYLGTVLYDGKYIRDYCKNDCQYCYNVVITKTGCAQYSTFNFEEGDNFVMLGHQQQIGESASDAEKRQSAIYLSAYESIDSGLRAPLIAQYRGINDYNLTNHRWSWFDASGATFKGQFITTDGTVISDVVKDYYKIVPNYTLLTKTPNDDIEQHTVKVSILSNINSIVTYTTSVPTGCKLNIYYLRANGTSIQISTINAGNSTASIPVLYNNSQLSAIDFELVKDNANEDVCDEFILNVQTIDASQGTPGDPGVSYNLAPEIEVCSVRIDDPTASDVQFENMTSSLYVKLQYKLIKVEGDNATPMQWVEPYWDSSTQTTKYYGKYNVTLFVEGISDFDAEAYAAMIHDPDWSGPSWDAPMVVNEDVGWSVSADGYTLSFECDNFLEFVNPAETSPYYNNNYRNYQWLIENYYDSLNPTSDRTPTIIYAQLVNDTYSTLDIRTMNVIYETQSLFVNNKNILYSAKVSGESYTDNSVQGVRTWTQNNYSTIQQTSQNINLAVGSLRNEINGDLTQNYYNKSQIDVLADQITLNVQSNVSGDLRNTGIDIEDGIVNIRADNFTIHDSNNNQILGVQGSQFTATDMILRNCKITNDLKFKECNDTAIYGTQATQSDPIDRINFRLNGIQGLSNIYGYYLQNQKFTGIAFGDIDDPYSGDGGYKRIDVQNDSIKLYNYRGDINGFDLNFDTNGRPNLTLSNGNSSIELQFDSSEKPRIAFTYNGDTRYYNPFN